MNLFGSLTKNCPKLDKNKSIVPRFSVFVACKSAVTTVEKSNSGSSVRRSGMIRAFLGLLKAFIGALIYNLYKAKLESSSDVCTG